MSVLVTERVAVREVDCLQAPLDQWLADLASRQPPELAVINPEAHYTGLFVDERLAAAIGFSFTHKGSIFIDALVCEPSKTGYHSAVALFALMRKCWEGRRVTFCTSLTNRHILRALKKYTTARPVYSFWEMTA